MSLVTTSLRARVKLLEQYLASKQMEFATKLCLEILRAYPQAIEARRMFAETLVATNESSRALQEYHSILKIDPESVAVNLGLATALERTGDIAGALDCYHLAYEVEPGNVAIKVAYNRTARIHGFPSLQQTRSGLARTYMRGGMLDRAIAEWEVILFTTPTRLDAQVGFAQSLWQFGQTDKFMEVCEIILDNQRWCLKPLLMLAYTEMQRGHTNEARLLCNDAALLDPDLELIQTFYNRTLSSEDTEIYKLLSLIEKPRVRIDHNEQSESAGANLHQLSNKVDITIEEVIPPSDTSSRAILENLSNKVQKIAGDIEQRTDPQIPASAKRMDLKEQAPLKEAESHGISLIHKDVRYSERQYELFFEAQRLLDAELFEQATPLLRNLIKREPELVPLIITTMQKMLELYPEQNEFYRVLGDGYLRQGHFEAALDAYTQSMNARAPQKQNF